MLASLRGQCAQPHRKAGRNLQQQQQQGHMGIKWEEVHLELSPCCLPGSQLCRTCTRALHACPASLHALIEHARRSCGQHQRQQKGRINTKSAKGWQNVPNVTCAQ